MDNSNPTSSRSTAQLQFLQDFINSWATKHYRLSLNDDAILDSLKAFCLETAESCPVDNLDVMHIVGGFIGMLEVRLSEGGRIGVEFKDGNWNIFAFLPDQHTVALVEKMGLKGGQNV